MVRQLYRILMPAVLLAAVLSCRSTQLPFPEGVGENPADVTEINVTTTDGVSFSPNSVLSAWQIVNVGKEFLFITDAGGSSASFRPVDTTTNRLYYALYPAVDCDSLYRGAFYLELDQEQKAVKDSYEQDLMLRAGKIMDGKEVQLEPVTGTLKFIIDQTDVYSCTIVSKGDNAMTGPIKIVMDETIRPEAAENSAGKVILYGGLEKGGTYNVVVISDEYTAFDVTLKNSLGITVWEGTASAFGKLSGGGSIDLGHLGNENISGLDLSFTSEEFSGSNVKSVLGYSAKSREKIFGSENCGTIKSSETMKVRFYGLEPADYSDTEIWYVFTLEKDGVSRVLPIKEQGIVIPKSTIVQLDLGELSSSRNAAPWYYPYEEKRLVCGAGYAFGQANTFLIQYKGSSYGTALDPDPEIPSSVVIDYRVRGDLFKSPRPENVEFEWLQGYNNSTPAWGKYTMDRTNIYNCDKYTFTADPDNYTVTVTNTGAHAGSPILLMKDKTSGEVLWAWTFWNIAADGTRLEAVDFGDVKLANMDIGHCSTKIAEITGKLKEIRYSANYYQWGRPMPTFSGSGAGVSLGQDHPNNAPKPRVPVCDGGAVSIEEALKHPGELIQYPFTPGTASENLLDWTSDGIASHTDLWGGKTLSDSAGVKSIYDPCPKGWRVPDARTFYKVFPEAKVCYSVEEYPQEHTTGYQGVYIGKLLFVTNGQLLTNISSDRYVSSGGYTHGTSSTAKGNGRVWTNTYYSGSKAYDFRTDYMYDKFNKAVENTSRMIRVDNSSVGCALPVRCQRDEDER